MGKVGIICVLLAVSFIILNFNPSNAYGKTTQWNSDINVGILESDVSGSDVQIMVTTNSFNSIKLEWDKPIIPKNFEIVGYEIYRKTLDTEYHIIVSNTGSLQTVYYDMDLAKDYYGYKVKPITQPKFESISMHGVDRNHIFFDQYRNGQELLAREILKHNYPQYLDDSFQEIHNIKLSPYFDVQKRDNDLSLQKNILKEIIKAERTYEYLYGKLDKITK